MIRYPVLLLLLIIHINSKGQDLKRIRIGLNYGVHYIDKTKLHIGSPSDLLIPMENYMNSYSLDLNYYFTKTFGVKLLADFYSKRTLEGYLTEIDNYMFSKYGSDYFLLSSYGNTYTKAPLLQGQYLGLNYRRNMGKNHVEFSTIFGWFYIENLVINRTYKQKNSHEKLIYQLGMDRPFLENGALGVVGNYNWTINEWVGLNVKILVSTVFIRDAVFYESEKSLITKETINKEYNYHTNLVSTSLTLGINFSFSSY